MMILKRIGAMVVLLLLFAAGTQALPPSVYFYGNANNDLYLLLKREGFVIKRFNTPDAAIKAAPKGAGVLIIAQAYPETDPVNRITQAMLDAAASKELRLYIEYPSAFPGLDIPDK